MTKYSSKLFAITCLSLVLLWACSSEDDATGGNSSTSNPLENYTSFPYDNLSQYGIFEGNMADLNHTDEVLPYELNSPLFSNYSLKLRHIYLPEGTSAKYVEDAVDALLKQEKVPVETTKAIGCSIKA